MISADALVAQAIRTTGLTDFGDDTLIERVRLVADTCNETAVTRIQQAARCQLP